MTSEEKLKTKERILSEARKLFSVHGYKGTSIRKIAEMSEVNLSAVSYHFGGKTELFWSVMNETYEWIESGVKRICEESTDIEGLARNTYLYLISDANYIVSAMRAMLSDLVPPPASDHSYSQKMNKSYFGPPGGEHMVEFIAKKYGLKESDESVQWAVMSIFSSIFHFTTFECAENFQEHKKCNLNPKIFENTVTHMSTAVIEYMLKHKDQSPDFFLAKGT